MVVPGPPTMIPIDDALAVKEAVSLESFVATLRKLDGRDKFTKLMQYGARFLAWWLSARDPDLSQRVFKLYRTTQRSRKAFRMLKILDEVVKLRQILRTAGGNSASSRTAFLGYAETLMSVRCLAMGAFWTFDNLNYLTITETVNFGVAKATRGFSRSWSVSSALAIMLGIDSLRKTEKKRREALSAYAAAVSERIAPPDRCGHCNGNGNSNGESYGVVERQRQRDGEGDGEGDVAGLREALRRANADHFKSWLMVLKGALDLTCAVNVTGMDFPKRLLGRKLNDGPFVWCMGDGIGR
ncbi:conserved unknown protein [Ectocarpus siliculosus]|uniref:Peroxisomal biogenesis factor 11 n=1 Tax=Ectocarpus siliculosus TaxID=2880 RepID=D8LER2_ECTSI|nr:conserved unknown protein [Ectocarpus siliculosus]|eukprot:CBN78625.1 conserved unknown protein [Ectocarpus siliculosus]